MTLDTHAEALAALLRIVTDGKLETISKKKIRYVIGSTSYTFDRMAGDWYFTYVSTYGNTTGVRGKVCGASGYKIEQACILADLVTAAK